MDKIYQRIGEFVVCFQWLEDLIRQIGWFIIDPERKVWPPQDLREESNSQLLHKVEKLYYEILEKNDIPDSTNRKKKFSNLISECHEFRKYRNNLLHSAYIELKGGGEVIDLMRSNPKLATGEQGEYIFDNEIMTEEKLNAVMTELGKVSFALGVEYRQLIQWIPLLK